jgi:hypothetical protein
MLFFLPFLPFCFSFFSLPFYPFLIIFSPFSYFFLFFLPTVVNWSKGDRHKSKTNFDQEAENLSK